MIVIIISGITVLVFIIFVVLFVIKTTKVYCTVILSFCLKGGVIQGAL